MRGECEWGCSFSHNQVDTQIHWINSACSSDLFGAVGIQLIRPQTLCVLFFYLLPCHSHITKRNLELGL